MNLTTNPLIKKLNSWLTPPVFEDEELTRRARIVHILYLSIIGASIVGILGDLEIISTIVIMIAGILLSTFAYKLNVRGQPERSGFIMLSIMICGLLALLLTGNGIHDIAVIVMPVLFFIASLILERRRFIQFTFLALGVLVFAFYAENNLPWFGIHPPTGTNVSDLFIVIAIMAIAAVSSYYLKNRLSVSLNRSHLADARIRALVENSPDFTLEIERSGKIVFINRFAETYLGKNVREVLPADQVDSALQVIEKAFTCGEPQAIELQTITPDGRGSWDSIRIGPIKSRGQTTSLTIIMTDITAQKQAESAIRESEERYRKAIAAAGMVPYVFDPSTRKLRFLGEGILSITGYPASELMSLEQWKKVELEGFPRGNLAHLTYDEANRITNEDFSIPWECDFRILTRDGQTRWIADTSVRGFDETGEHIVAIGIKQDITDRKRVESALRESEERYRLISSVTSDYTFSTKIDGEGHMSLNWVAGAFEAMTGYTLDEYRAHGGWLAHLYPEDVEKDRQALAKLENNQSVTHEIRTITKAKKLQWVQVYAHPIWDENTSHLVGIVGAVQDITARKQAEEKIRKTANQLVVLNEIDRIISEVTDLESVLEVIRQQLEKLVQFDFYSVRVFNETESTVTYLAVYESGKYWDEPDSPLIPGTHAWRVFEKGESILHLLTDAEVEHDRSVPYPHIGDHGQLTTSLIFVPLKKQGRTFGVLSVQRYQPNSYTIEHLNLVEAVAVQVAIAIKNAQLFTSMQQELVQRERAETALLQSASRLELLHNIDRALLSAQSPTEIAREALTRIRQLVPSQRVSITLFDFEKNEATFLVASFDEDFNPAGQSVITLQEYGQYIIDELLLDRACRVDDVLTDPRCNELDKALAQKGFRSWLFLPLFSQGHLIGGLNFTRAAGNPFTAEEESIAHEVANQLAIVLKQNQLYESLQAELSERKRVESALRESDERYELAVRGANDGLWDWDLRTNVIYYSPRWKSMLGIGEDEILNDPQEWLSRIHPDDLAEFKALLDAHLGGNRAHFETEYRISHASGNERWMLCRGLAVRDAEGRAYRMSGSQTDITDRKNAEERLTHDALHDVLTGLPNRNLFLDRLGRRLEYGKRHQGRPFAVLFLDLDRFKVINDSLGHSAGDEFLVAVAQQLQTCLRQEDTISRLGGDEFAILLYEIKDVGDAIHAAERLQARLAQGVILSSVNRSCSTSIGITVFNGQYSIPEELLRDADTAMYRAKALGGGCCQVFDVEMYESAIAQLELEADLKHAVENREWLVYYQPILSLDDGGISGLEALVRWNCPKRGIVSPADFIPLAEESGLIIPIGESVLREACAQLKIWRRKGHANLWVSVNISGRQFRDRNFVNMVKGILKESRLPGLCLRLEITESVAMKDFENSVNVLRILKRSGIHFSLDDFGKGYSSLAYLKNFPLKTLKVDRSFVQDIGLGRKREAIAASIIAMGHSLGMKVVAEGVETQKQLVFLRTNSCDEVQGFLFSRPLPQEEISRVIEGEPFLFQK